MLNNVLTEHQIDFLLDYEKALLVSKKTGNTFVINFQIMRRSRNYKTFTDTFSKR